MLPDPHGRLAISRTIAAGQPVLEGAEEEAVLDADPSMGHLAFLAHAAQRRLGYVEEFGGLGEGEDGHACGP